MATEKLDPTTGRTTTGHEWNGIEELNTPVPRIVFFFLAVMALFAVGYWILMPAWPTGVSFTKGMLGIDQRAVVTQQVRDAAAERAAWTDRIGRTSLEATARDPELMRYVRETGRTLFLDNCSACHGTKGTGGPGFPNLAARAWLWGGTPETIVETITKGINSTNDDTRVSQMLAFGRDGVLTGEQIRSVAAFVRSLSGQALDDGEKAMLPAGRKLFADNCASCHGDTGRGKHEMGAPDLADSVWIYGGDRQSVFDTIYAGRQGHMPHWSDRLSPTDIRILALYVGTLGAAK